MGALYGLDRILRVLKKNHCYRVLVNKDNLNLVKKNLLISLMIYDSVIVMMQFVSVCLRYNRWSMV